MALLFCVTSSTASLIRLSSNYHFLIASHLLSGLSTALLYCVFEAWYISQHQRKGKCLHFCKRQRIRNNYSGTKTNTIVPSLQIGFAPALIGATFSTAIFLNGLVAILAGIVSNIAVEWSGSLAAPFVVSAGTLVFAGLLISSSWEENYGESKTNASGSVLKSMLEGLVVLKSGKFTLFSFSLYTLIVHCPVG